MRQGRDGMAICNWRETYLRPKRELVSLSDVSPLIAPDLVLDVYTRYSSCTGVKISGGLTVSLPLVHSLGAAF